jgi:hypothetical protein
MGGRGMGGIGGYGATPPPHGLPVTGSYIPGGHICGGGGGVVGGGINGGCEG